MHIQVRGIRKTFGEKHILHDISLEVKKGQFTVLLGPSGCGKTTLLHILAGLIDIDEGEIYIGGKLYSARGFTLPAEQRKVGMIFQDFALWPHMSVFDNVAFGLKVLRLPANEIKDRVAEVLQLVQMQHHAEHFTHQLSGGQKQRIAIARAMATQPEVLLMDEPLSSLDAGLREQMRWDLLRIIQDAGMTAIYVTHDQQEALSMADEIVLLNEGRIRQRGTATKLYREPNSEFVASFLGAANMLPGTVNTNGGFTVDDNGFMTSLPSYDALPGERVTVMFRPSDIAPGYGAANQEGLTFAATIMQRAYHGFVWQYRVESTGSPLQFEVWNAAEWPIGSLMDFSVPSHACHLIREPLET